MPRNAMRPPSSLRTHLTRRLGTFVAQRVEAVAAVAKPMPRDLEAVTFTDLSRPRAKRRRHRSVLTGRVEGGLAQELNLGKGPFFGFLGSLYRYAGLSWIIPVAGQLRARGRQFHVLVIVGG